MITTDLIPTYLFLAVGILILGGIFLIYSSLEVKDSMKLFKEVNKNYSTKITHLYENIKCMVARIDSCEARIIDSFTEDCQRIADEHERALWNHIDNIDNLEKIYTSQVDNVRRNTQKIDDLYQKTYRLQVNQSKQNAQKAISEKHMLRRYGKRHKK